MSKGYSLFSWKINLDCTRIFLQYVIMSGNLYRIRYIMDVYSKFKNPDLFSQKYQHQMANGRETINNSCKLTNWKMDSHTHIHRLTRIYILTYIIWVSSKISKYWASNGRNNGSIFRRKKELKKYIKWLTTEKFFSLNFNKEKIKQ